VGFHGGADNCYVILKDVSGNYCWQLIGYDAASAGAGGRLVMGDADGNTVMDMRDAGTNIFIKNSLRLDVDSLKIELGAGQDLQLFHDGTNSTIDNNTGDLLVRQLGSSGDIYLDPKSGERGVKIIRDGAVELYNAGSKKFWTVDNGAEITGNLKLSDSSSTDTGRLNLGADHDLSIYHNGTLSRLDNSTGNLVIRTKVSGSFVDTLILDTSSNATFAGTVSDSLGNLRSIPENARGTTYTLVATDAGKCVTQTHSSGFTIDNSVFSAGDAVTMINNSGSDQTITQGSGVTLYNSADASTGNRTLASRGMATVWFQSASVGYISGAGLS
jgi:hypothetical protein